MREPGLPLCIDSISLYLPMQMAAQSGQKFSIPSPSFCKSSPALSEVKQPPPYEDAVKQVTAWFLFSTGLGLPMMSFLQSVGLSCRSSNLFWGLWVGQACFHVEWALLKGY